MKDKNESRISLRAEAGRESLSSSVREFLSPGHKTAGNSPCSAWKTVRALTCDCIFHTPSHKLSVFSLLKTRSKEEISCEVTYFVNILPLCFLIAFINTG